MSELTTILDFDHVVRIGADGWVDANPVGAPYAPTAYDPEPYSLIVEKWELITSGLTGQYSYNGPWLHNDEQIEGAVERRVFEHAAENGGGYYVAIYGQFSCTEDHEHETCETDLEGWAIAYKELS